MSRNDFPETDAARNGFPNLRPVPVHESGDPPGSRRDSEGPLETVHSWRRCTQAADWRKAE